MVVSVYRYTATIDYSVAKYRQSPLPHQYACIVLMKRPALFGICFVQERSIGWIVAGAKLAT
jgi:hypothetical protein